MGIREGIPCVIVAGGAGYVLSRILPAAEAGQSRTLAFSTLAGVAIYVLQGRGRAYQMCPAVGFVILLVCHPSLHYFIPGTGQAA